MTGRRVVFFLVMVVFFTSLSNPVQSTPILVKLDQTGATDWVGLRLDRSSAEKWFVGMGNTDDYLIFRNNGSDNFMTIQTTGNVGIGTVNPTYKLHVAGDNPRILIQDTASSNPEVNFRSSATINPWNIYLDNTSQDLRFYHSGDRVTFANTDGSVGIGTNNPSAKLTVEGKGAGISATTHGLRVHDSAGKYGLLVYDTGEVSVGELYQNSTSHFCRVADGSGWRIGFCSSASEYVPTADNGWGYPEEGDLVSILPNVDNPAEDGHAPFVVGLAHSEDAPNLVGFITDPEKGADGVPVGADYLPLAIYGYFPVKVCLENGPIRRGDPITLSSTAGWGMKATNAGRIIGYALEDIDKPGMIQVMTQAGYHHPPGEDTGMTYPDTTHVDTRISALEQENAELKKRLTLLEAKLSAVLFQ